jgi:hypothetical protein
LPCNEHRMRGVSAGSRRLHEQARARAAAPHPRAAPQPVRTATRTGEQATERSCKLGRGNKEEEDTYRQGVAWRIGDDVARMCVCVCVCVSVCLSVCLSVCIAHTHTHTHTHTRAWRVGAVGLLDREADPDGDCAIEPCAGEFCDTFGGVGARGEWVEGEGWAAVGAMSLMSGGIDCLQRSEHVLKTEEPEFRTQGLRGGLGKREMEGGGSVRDCGGVLQEGGGSSGLVVWGGQRDSGSERLWEETLRGGGFRVPVAKGRIR